MTVTTLVRYMIIAVANKDKVTKKSHSSSIKHLALLLIHEDLRVEGSVVLVGLILKLKVLLVHHFLFS